MSVPEAICLLLMFVVSGILSGFFGAKDEVNSFREHQAPHMHVDYYQAQLYGSWAYMCSFIVSIVIWTCFIQDADNFFEAAANKMGVIELTLPFLFSWVLGFFVMAGTAYLTCAHIAKKNSYNFW